MPDLRVDASSQEPPKTPARVDAIPRDKDPKHGSSVGNTLTSGPKQDSFCRLRGLTPWLRVVALHSASSNQVTELLARWSEGDTAAREALLPVVYNELRRLAGRCLASQRNQTLQSTALVHEAYLRLVAQSPLRIESRTHFFGIAARLMREILVDHARMRRAAKRGANCLTLSLDEAIALPKKREVDLIALDDALNSLAILDPRQSQIVDLRFFGGLSIEDTSCFLGISPATVKREWATARLWLQRELIRSEPA
jgi:RNA polymerase sigma factor (TIGR02999 family)